MWSIFFLICLVSSENINVGSENFHDLLKGEWFVKFYAPWCPACSSIKQDWNKMDEYLEALGVNLAEANVEDDPLFSGRFFVSKLPTIYHIKDGVFREYNGRRNFDSMLEFIEDRGYEELDPVPFYKDPKSSIAKIMGYAFWASIKANDVANVLKSKGYSNITIVILAAIATISSGVILGFTFVVIFEFIYPVKNRVKVAKNTEEKVDEKILKNSENKNLRKRNVNN